ncbi:MAG: transcription antitermination factor NusB [Acidobacteria bacterium]|nr:MAG: transcription antitermination factor NusB [Acidobacteriota bacterium]
MFAADFAKFPENFPTVDYWRNFGFDEVNKGTSQIARNYLEEISSLEILIKKELKPITKKNLHIADSTDNLLDLLAKVERLYKQTIETAIESKSPEKWEEERENLLEAVSSFESRLRKILEFLQQDIQKNEKNYLLLEIESVNEIKEQTSHILDRMRDSLETLSEVTEEVFKVREYADRLVLGTISRIHEIDEMISKKAEHWRIPRMATVDRNIIRIAIFEFLDGETPKTVVINEAIEIARHFSTAEATQFINGILDAVKSDLEAESGEAVMSQSASSQATEKTGWENDADESF